MDLIESIKLRTSRRTYTSEEIESSKVAKLQELIKNVNKEGNLHLQLVLNNGEALQGFKRSYGMFSGVDNYVAMIGKNDKALKEKLGYYGEKIVLEATRLGLGTCWVGGTFDKGACPCKVEENETFYAVIIIGNVPQEHTLKERLILKAVHRKTKAAIEMYEADYEPPQWFKDGMECVQKAPSAVNKQPVKFYYKDSIVTAKISDSCRGFEEIDLGIAKYHFEIGANGGKWEWGNGAAFNKE